MVSGKERSHIDHEKQRKMAAAYFSTIEPVNWSKKSARLLHPYMPERGYESRTLKHFDVRINPSSQYEVIIPLKHNEEFMGWVGRRLDGGEPKYLYNTHFKRRITIGGDLVEGPVLVAEGMLDIMKAWQNGFENSVALLGWSCSEEQAEKIRKFATMIICATDNDRAGDKGFIKLQERFKGDDIEVVRYKFPDGYKDIGEMDEETFRSGLPAE